MLLDNIFIFLAGLGLFLMSFQIIVKHMQKVMGSKIRSTVKNAGSSKLRGLGLGALSTSIFQNSTAVIVLIISFVEMGALTLLQSVPLVLGVNIGASLTLLTIFLSSISFSVYVSSLALVGVAIAMFCKKGKGKSIGFIIFAIGILFLGMHLMSSSMSFLKTIPEFTSFLTSISNPLLLVCIGLIVGTIIQSSLASNAILITLCAIGGVSGLGIESALWLSFSFKLGPTLMGVIASIGAKKASRTVALFHFLMNFIILIVFSLSTLTGWHIAFANLVQNPALVIVLENIIVCTFTCLLLLPFTKGISKVLNKIYKEDKSKYSAFEMSDNILTYGGVAIEHLSKQANILQSQIVEDVTLLLDSYFTEKSNISIKQLNKKHKEFEYVCNLFDANLAKIKGGVNEEEKATLRYFYNLTSRYSSMRHRFEKLVALLEDTDFGKNFTDIQEKDAKELFAKVKDLAQMSSSMLSNYLAKDTSKCYYLNNVVQLDKEVAQIKIEIKKDMIDAYRQEKKGAGNAEKFGRLINETEQLGEHFTAIGLNML